jgi:predicted HicB family RNase H-like nuclease
MNNTLRYKNYLASVAFSAEDNVFYGKILGINDVVVFEGSSVDELLAAFQEATDDYLETCITLHKSPDKPYNGSFNVRIPRDLHRQAALMAQQKNITLNQFVRDAIDHSLHQNAS